MNYIKIENLTKSYGEKLLFENISFTINKGQKVALVAKNGSGKTSLLNLILGKDIPDSGKIEINKDIIISYLSQNPNLNEKHSILETIYESTNPKIQILKRYNELILNNDKSSHEELEEIISTIDNQQLWNFESEIKEILGQFKIQNLQLKINQLSGGQKKRVALAKTLVEESNIIILDEPTNHLDIDMIEWLEAYLDKQNKSVFLITHDRYFLDRVCDEILEMEHQQIYHHRGNYNYYLEKKNEREIQENASIDKARNLYKKELEWMRRQPKARTTKSKARIDSFYELKKTAHKKTTNNKTKLEVDASRIGKKIIELKSISKFYSDLTLIKNFSYIFKRGERIGIVGENGCGKSTLLNIITKKIEPDTGEVVHGLTTDIGYYNQEGLKPKPGKRIIEIVKEIAENVRLKQGVISASQFLHHFGFDHNSQYNYFENLSGGEKRKLHLLLTLIKNPNFLILDEPTNDLDIETLRTLEEFIQEFPGCVLIVSHDRYFLDRSVDYIIAFKGNGILKIYPGNYSNYFNKRNEELKQEKQSKKIKGTTKTKNKSEKVKKLSFKEKQELEKLEEIIPRLEEEKEAILEQMNLETDNNKLLEISNKYAILTETLEEKELRWLELSDY